MRRAALVLALLGLLGCHHGKAGYASFQDVPYDYPAGRLVWCPQAGLHVYVAELGPRASEKPPLVLLHPWGLSMTVWSDIAPQLARDRRVVLVDLPGHGKSDKLHTRYPMSRMATAVLEAMDAVGVDRAVIGGNSLGGATALAVAEHAPNRVAALMLLAAPGGGLLPEPARHAARTMANERWLESLSDEGWFVGVVAVERSLSPTAARIRDDLVALRRSREWSAWCRATITILRSVAEYQPALERITAPALVVHGTGDLLITEGLNSALAGRLPHGRLAVLEGCGHLMEVECPEPLMAEVVPFLAEVR